MTGDDLDYLNSYELPSVINKNVKILEMSYCCNESYQSELDNGTDICFLGFMELELGHFKVHISIIKIIFCITSILNYILECLPSCPWSSLSYHFYSWLHIQYCQYSGLNSSGNETQSNKPHPHRHSHREGYKHF